MNKLTFKEIDEMIKANEIRERKAYNRTTIIISIVAIVISLAGMLITINYQ